MPLNHSDIYFVNEIMSKFVALLITICLLASCNKPDKMDTILLNIPATPVDTVAPKTYLALGDSYTIGQSVAISQRFPEQVVAILNDRGVKFVEPEIIAQTGWTTQNLLDRLQAAAPLKQQYDIVTLLIGVNNQYDHLSRGEYADQFLVLLNKAIGYAGNSKKRVIVLSIPDYSVTPFASGSNQALIANEIDQFNAINKNISDSLKVQYVDITPSSRLAANNLSLVATDGLHPSGLEYKVWADEVIPAIIVALQ